MTYFNKAKHLFLWALAIVLGIIVLFAAIIGGVFFATFPFHTVSLWRIEHAVSVSIPHPAETNAVERFSFLGSRYIDDAECTYAAGEIRSTSLTKQKLLEQYENVTVNLFGFARHMPVNVVIVDKDASLPIGEPAGDWIYDFVQRVYTRSTDTTYYLVYLYETGRSNVGDYRCLERDL